MSLSATFQPILAPWRRMAPREKSLLQLAAALVMAALLWLLVVAPSLATLRMADAQARMLDEQLQRMQQLQAQASAIQKQTPLGFDESVRALSQATQQTLGTAAQMNVTGDRASVTLKAVPADALASWLSQARINARSVPLEARLTRATTAGPATWSGVLIMRLPQR